MIKTYRIWKCDVAPRVFDLTGDERERLVACAHGELFLKLGAEDRGVVESVVQGVAELGEDTRFFVVQEGGS